MAGNSFGRHFVVTSFGESHGHGLGAVIDGMPAGVPFNSELLKKDLQRRRPGQSAFVSQRNEQDEPEILSGIFENKTLGTPIAVVLRNQDARSKDYQSLSPRPGHADDVWQQKFGHVDPRGGGRSSGRETASRVIGGAFAKMFLQTQCPEVLIRGFVSRIGPFFLSDEERQQFCTSKKTSDEYPQRFPSGASEEVSAYLSRLVESGDSCGGSVAINISGVPSGLGLPVFQKLKADFASALMSIGATTSFEIGAGVFATQSTGQIFHRSSSSHYGGIRGGISTGEPIYMQLGFKPTSSIMDVAKKGRHDPCIVIRAVPVVEAMVALVLADHVLAKKLDKIESY